MEDARKSHSASARLSPSGKPATAVVVEDQVATLADIVARHSTPRAAAPLMREFMADWDRWHDWLRGLDLKPGARTGSSSTAAKFLAPVPEPNNIFHLYHNFERPSRVTGKSDPPKAERVLPDVFFGSRSALAGYGDTIYREHGGMQFDFEVEVTAVIGKPGDRVAGREGRRITSPAMRSANDLTMHFAWWREIRATKPDQRQHPDEEFPGYTPMSRVIVPRDLVGDPHDLRVARLDRRQVHQDARTNAMLWHDGETVEYCRTS